MIQLVDLEGLSGEVNAVSFSSVARGIALLKQGIVGTAAQSNGAINIWLDREGLYRGTCYRYCVQQSSIVTDSMPKMRAWLKSWLAAIS